MMALRFSKKTMKKIKMAAVIFGAVILVTLIGILIKTRMNYIKINPDDYLVISCEGYDGKGSAVSEFDGEGMRNRILEAYDKYTQDYFNFQNDFTQADYEKLFESFQWELSDLENLSNGQEITLNYTYDEALAKKLRVSILSEERKFAVTGLPTAKVIKPEDLYRDVKVTFEGEAPNITVQIENNSQDEFLKTVSFIEDTPGAMYHLGDTVVINAVWNDVQAVKLGYSIEAENSNCKKEYIVENVDSYVTKIDQIPQEIIDQLIQKGASLIDGTKCDYGLRVFTEAGLDYNLAGAAAPFTYSSPRTLSMYLKSIKTDAEWIEGYDYNNLDIIYAVTITQAGGMNCEAEAAMRIRNLVLKPDGTCVADIDSMEIATVSYHNNSVLKNVIDFYEENYNVEKVALR